MRTGTTTSGFHFEIDDSALDDWELVEALSEVDEGKPNKIVTAIKLLLGSEGATALKEHCRRDGRVSATVMMSEVAEIFNIIKDSQEGKPIKNS